MTTPPSIDLDRAPAAPLHVASSEEGDREDCRLAYHRVPWQLVRGVVLLCTAALLIVGLSNPVSLQRAWYHALEGCVSLAFCVEVFWRIRIARSEWRFQSLESLVEVGCAVVCVLLFVVLMTASSVSSVQGTAEEVILVVLGVVQGWRMFVAIRTSVAAERERHVMILDTRRVVAVETEAETAELRSIV